MKVTLSYFKDATGLWCRAESKEPFVVLFATGGTFAETRQRMLAKLRELKNDIATRVPEIEEVEI